MAKKKIETVAPEWSHFIEAEKIATTPMKLTVSPGPEERKRLAKRMNLTELKSFESDLVLSRDTARNVIFISGNIRAEVTQPSVVSGKPVKSEVTDSFEAWYVDTEQAVSFAKAKKERLAKEGQIDQPFLDESEDPEPIVGGQIDLGELTAQYLSLALNPYPRLEGEEFAGAEPKTGAGEDVYENPFAALKNWKQGLDKGE